MGTMEDVRNTIKGVPPEKVEAARMSLRMTAILFYAASLLFLFILVTGGLLIGWSGERRALMGNALTGGTGILLLLLSALGGTIFLKAAAAVGRGEKRSRPLAVGLGIVILSAFPVGSLLGFFILSGLLSEDAGSWFRGAKSPDSLPEEFPEAIVGSK